MASFVGLIHSVDSLRLAEAISEDAVKKDGEKMKGNNYWSYAPYRPLLTDVGDIYICRLSNGDGFFECELLFVIGYE